MNKQAFLFGVCASGALRLQGEEHLQELERLCDTYGFSVCGKNLSVLKKRDAGLYLGKGKLQEIFLQISTLPVDILIFDEELSPNQQRNLEAFFKRPVIDRTELILEVFAKHAKTKEAHLQIELAKIRYELPRLKRMWTHLSRQSSGGGHVKGEGEKQIEIDRRLLKRRLCQLEKELEEVILHRKTQRLLRERSHVPTIAIVGYTNAGKSTLMRALTGADVLIEDKLFATLDTTTRKHTLPNKQDILLIDTVGFIRKIPHTLIKAFKSTLEEAIHTDILIHLIDASHLEAVSQAEATLSVLKELGVQDKPILTVLNKIDVCPIYSAALLDPKNISISAVTGQGLDLLQAKIMEVLSSLRTMLHLRVPQEDYGLLSDMWREGKVLEISYEDNDVLLMVEVPKILEIKLAKYRILEQ